jgi:hypothetical protein
MLKKMLIEFLSEINLIALIEEKLVKKREWN